MDFGKIPSIRGLLQFSELKDLVPPKDFISQERHGFRSQTLAFTQKFVNISQGDQTELIQATLTK